MRKQLLAALLLSSGVATLSAQSFLSEKMESNAQKVQETSTMLQANPSGKMELNEKGVTSRVSRTSLMEKQTLFNSERANIQTRAAVEAMYDIPIGAFYTGIFSEGWYNLPIVNSPVNVPATFLNYSTEGATTTWTINTEKETIACDDLDERGNMTFKAMFGTVEAPLLEVKQGTSKASYQLASKESVGIWAGGTDIQPLSSANPTFGVYGNYKNGPSFDYGQPYYDTNKNLNAYVTLIQAPMKGFYAKGMYALVISESKPISKTGVLGVQLYKYSEKELFGEKMMIGQAEAADVTAIGTQGLYLIHLRFINQQGEPIVLEGLENQPVVAAFSGEGLDMTMTFASANGFAGGSYVIVGEGEDSELLTYGYTDNPDMPGFNFHVGFIGAYPYAEVLEETKTSVIPVGGGKGVTITEDGKDYNEVMVMTSVSWKDEFFESQNYNIVSQPDWVKVTYSDELVKDNAVMCFYAEAEALPAGEEGRSGEVKFDVCGQSISFKVVQGNVVGIQNHEATVTSAVCSDNNIQLTYPGSVTSVAIINVAGQTIATYDLPANGQYTISASELNKGLYLLKFSNNETVKVAK